MLIIKHTAYKGNHMLPARLIPSLITIDVAISMICWSEGELVYEEFYEV